ncbi:MAG: radical SAM protein [Candidatus Woesearchaeota archaeon]|jgi:radical SAM superfamily enzyme YgiQ (UPF0313 family)
MENKAKILFIQKDPFVNMGVMSISAYLKKHGHTCDLLIDNIERKLLDEIIKIKPDIIAFSCTTGIHTWVLSTAKKIKKKYSIPIIMGGHHPTFYPEVIENESIDIICIGDGEKPMLELVNKLSTKKDITKIKNLYVKKNGKIYKNELDNLVQNLDELPFIDRFIYKRYPFIIKQKNLRIITGRGCPYNCTFCFNKSIKQLYDGKGRYLRRRSVENVIQEIIHAKKTLKIKRIDFQDDTFVYDFNNWLKPFLIEYKKRINLPFTCSLRANLITQEMAYALKTAGCHSIKMGIESGNDFLNNKILGKNLSKKQIINAMMCFRNAKIKTETFNMIGLPGETLENALETLRFNMKIKADFARCSLLQPYPKTEIERYAKEKGYLDKNFDLDAFESSYFIDTPIKMKNKNEMINLQRLFNICVNFPFLYPIIKKIIFLPKNFVFDTLFKIDYAIAILFIDKVDIMDFFNFGIHSKGFFKKQK